MQVLSILHWVLLKNEKKKQKIFLLDMFRVYKIHSHSAQICIQHSI